MPDTPRRAHCITITIVGAMPLPMDDTQFAQFDAFMRRVEDVWWEMFPDFFAARPPIASRL